MPRISTRARLAVCATVLCAAIPSLAQAEGPVLRVTDLGQPSAPIEVAQPPIDVAATASCASPFTIVSEGACPAGTWPALGRAWGQIEDVAGGDTLRFEFTAPVISVRLASTSNYEPGLTDPDGRSIANYDVVPDSATTATASPATWTTALPPLDARAISSQGYTFSVVAQDGAGYHDYPFGIRAPRYANEATRCGMAYYSTGWQQSLCLGLEKGSPPRLGEHRKKHGCRKGFRRKTIRGKVRCVKVKKPHPNRR
jgi:hypothetical protein